MHKVVFERSAKKELDKLPRRVGDRVALAIAALAEDPRRGATKVKRIEGAFRIRVGDYRVIFEIDDSQQIVAVLRIRKPDESTYDL